MEAYATVDTGPRLSWGGAGGLSGRRCRTRLRIACCVLVRIVRLVSAKIWIGVELLCIASA